MKNVNEENKKELVEDLTKVTGKVNQTILWKSLNILATKGVNDEEACDKTRVLFKEFPVLFPQGYSCLNKRNRRIISRMLGYDTTLIVVYNKD